MTPHLGRALLIAVVASLPLSDPARSDGGGRLMTPYTDLAGQAGPIDLARVTCEMRNTAVSRSIENYKVDWPKPFFGSVRFAGLAFVNPTRAAGNMKGYAVEVFHFLEGRSDDQPITRIDFSRLSSIEVLNKSDMSIRLRVRLFPTTDAAVIARNQLTYSALKNDLAEAIIEVPTRNQAGDDLTLVSLGRIAQDCRKDISDLLSTKLKSVAVDPSVGSELKIQKYLRFGDLPAGVYSVGVASPSEDIWWAVPSVIADPAYPYRRQTAQ